MLRLRHVNSVTTAAFCGTQHYGVEAGRESSVLNNAPVLRTLYRRLRKEGETRQMIERSLSVHSLETNIRAGLRLLHYHTMLVNLNRETQELAFWRLMRRLKLAAFRRYFAWRIFIIRLRFRSTAAFSDALVYFLLLASCFMLYQMYRVCRIGVTRAEERYRTLAVPIQQTFEALEHAHKRRRKLRQEMEEDMVHHR